MRDSNYYYMTSCIRYTQNIRQRCSYRFTSLKDRVSKHRPDSFRDFSKSSQDISCEKITLDQWTSFLDFCLECQNVSSYEEDGSAWPTLIDDYVQYCLDHGHK